MAILEHTIQIRFSRLAEKQFPKLPFYIKEAIEIWLDAVSEKGIREIRKTPGYHDEPLKGNRSGQRSIRLSKSYRLIYEESIEGYLELIVIIEVNKHDY